MKEVVVLLAQTGVTATVCYVWARVSIEKKELASIPIPVIAAVCAAWGLKIVPGIFGGAM